VRNNEVVPSPSFRHGGGRCSPRRRAHGGRIGVRATRRPAVEHVRVARLGEQHARSFELHDQPFSTAAERLDRSGLSDMDLRLFVGRKEQSRVHEEGLSSRNFMALQRSVVAGKKHPAPLLHGDARQESTLPAATTCQAPCETGRNLDVVGSAQEGLSRNDPAVIRSDRKWQQIARQVQPEGHFGR